jgi:hypothetical protein
MCIDMYREVGKVIRRTLFTKVMLREGNSRFYALRVGRLAVVWMRDWWNFIYPPENAPHDSGLKVVWLSADPRCEGTILFQRIATVRHNAKTGSVPGGGSQHE